MFDMVVNTIEYKNKSTGTLNSKCIIWAHNSHVGNSLETDSRNINLGNAYTLKKYSLISFSISRYDM